MRRVVGIMDYYEIIVRGHLDARRADCFDGLELQLLPDGRTRVAGPVRDAAELHAILNRIRDMGLPLISVRLIGQDSLRRS